jgi:DnaJ-class molecular chaperone
MQGMNNTDDGDQVWPCPNCRGLGTLNDGCLDLGPYGSRVIRPASKCRLCEGKGKVHASPMPEDKPCTPETCGER